MLFYVSLFKEFVTSSTLANGKQCCCTQIQGHLGVMLHTTVDNQQLDLRKSECDCGRKTHHRIYTNSPLWAARPHICRYKYTIFPPYTANLVDCSHRRSCTCEVEASPRGEPATLTWHKTQYTTRPSGTQESRVEGGQVPTYKPQSRALQEVMQGRGFTRPLIAFLKSSSESISTHTLQKLYRQCRPIKRANRGMWQECPSTQRIYKCPEKLSRLHMTQILCILQYHYLFAVTFSFLR